MASDNVLAEALARIEHKLDRLLERQLKQPIEQLGALVACPICKQQVDYQVDQINKVIARKCGCKTGLQAPLDLNAFAPPAPAPRKDNPDGADHEDRSNPPADRRYPVR